MGKNKKSDLEEDCACMEKCVKAFEELSRHYCEKTSSDSVAISQAKQARIRTLQWLCRFIEDHPYL